MAKTTPADLTDAVRGPSPPEALQKPPAQNVGRVTQVIGSTFDA